MRNGWLTGKFQTLHDEFFDTSSSWYLSLMTCSEREKQRNNMTFIDLIMNVPCTWIYSITEVNSLFQHHCVKMMSYGRFIRRIRSKWWKCHWHCPRPRPRPRGLRHCLPLPYIFKVEVQVNSKAKSTPKPMSTSNSASTIPSLFSCHNWYPHDVDHMTLSSSSSSSSSWRRPYELVS